MFITHGVNFATELVYDVRMCIAGVSHFNGVNFVAFAMEQHCYDELAIRWALPLISIYSFILLLLSLAFYSSFFSA